MVAKNILKLPRWATQDKVIYDDYIRSKFFVKMPK
jgi:hypothetical protein